MAELTSRAATVTLSAELAHLSPSITANIAEMRRVAYNTGAVPSKYKLLTAVALSVTIRCEPCIRAYVEWAGKKGATKAELVEFLNVAMTMQGCPGEEWSLKALAAFNELVEGTTSRTDSPAADGGCCTHS